MKIFLVPLENLLKIEQEMGKFIQKITQMKINIIMGAVGDQKILNKMSQKIVI